RHEEHVLLAGETEAELVRGVRRIAEDHPLARRLAIAGRQHVVKHHDWRAISQKMEQALLDLVGKRRYSSSTTYTWV
ncbi:MAG: glycosyltransferase family 4 protein, partial [bacterium]|nr:glycosyltransferase family 4 protein [bacterium]